MLYSWFDSWPSASRRRQNPIDMVACSSSRLLLKCNSNTILLSFHSKESAFRILLTQLLLEERKDLKDSLFPHHKSTLLLLRNALPGFLKILSSYVTADFRWRHLRFPFCFSVWCASCSMSRSLLKSSDNVHPVVISHLCVLIYLWQLEAVWLLSILFNSILPAR